MRCVGFQSVENDIFDFNHTVRMGPTYWRHRMNWILTAVAGSPHYSNLNGNDVGARGSGATLQPLPFPCQTAELKFASNAISLNKIITAGT